jgi:drug/metabolite transporter (DMT)-like permease
MKTSRFDSRALLLLSFLAIYVVWGSTYLAIAFGVETIPPLLLMAVRFLLAGGVLYVWARRQGAPAPSPTNWGAALVTGALLFTATHGLLAWAELRVASGLAALLGATSPLWIVLMDRAHGGRTGGRLLPLAGSLAGILGVLVLMGPSAMGGARPDLLGAGAVLLSAGMWSWGMMLTRSASLPSSLALSSAVQLIAGGGLLFLASASTGELSGFDVRAVSLKSVLALGYLVVFGSIVAFSAYAWLLRTTTPARISTHSFVNPLVAVVLGWTLNAEVLTPRLLVAGAIIVVAIVLVVMGGRAQSVSKRLKPAIPMRVPVYEQGRKPERTQARVA